MRWNRSAKMLTAAAALAIAPAVSWAQVTINNGTPIVNPIPGGVTASAPGAVNGGAGVNAIGSTGGTLNALSPTGGNGNVSGNGLAKGPSILNGMAGGAGLLGSAHDFVSGANTSYNYSSAGLCTYCHTPHKAKSTLLLWNHTLSQNTFQWDVAATTAGTALPGFKGNGYNGPSAKCLSCHDGSVAIGDVGWFNDSSLATGAAALSTYKVGTNDAGLQVGAGGNLSGNHPVAVPYPLGGAAGVYNGSTTGAQLATNDFVSDPTGNNIRLYSDQGGGAITGNPKSGMAGIECSSCHDPHNKASTDDFFLRGKMTGSTAGAGGTGYICLACHVK